MTEYIKVEMRISSESSTTKLERTIQIDDEIDEPGDREYELVNIFSDLVNACPEFYIARVNEELPHFFDRVELKEHYAQITSYTRSINNDKD